jgi:hypothetical protein
MRPLWGLPFLPAVQFLVCTTIYIYIVRYTVYGTYTVHRVLTCIIVPLYHCTRLHNKRTTGLQRALQQADNKRTNNVQKQEQTASKGKKPREGNAAIFVLRGQQLLLFLSAPSLAWSFHTYIHYPVHCPIQYNTRTGSSAGRVNKSRRRRRRRRRREE